MTIAQGIPLSKYNQPPEYPPNVVPPKLFATVTLPETTGGMWRTKPYASHQTSEYVIREAMATMQIQSVWALGLLLGLPCTNVVYQWLNGRQRMSQFYLCRLMKLVMLHTAGIPLFRVQTINWDTGEIIYKKPRGKNAKGPGAGAADRGDLPPTKIRAKS